MPLVCDVGPIIADLYRRRVPMRAFNATKGDLGNFAAIVVNMDPVFSSSAEDDLILICSISSAAAPDGVQSRWLEHEIEIGGAVHVIAGAAVPTGTAGWKRYLQHGAIIWPGEKLNVESVYSAAAANNALVVSVNGVIVARGALPKIQR